MGVRNIRWEEVNSSFSGVAGMRVNELLEAAQASWIML